MLNRRTFCSTAATATATAVLAATSLNSRCHATQARNSAPLVIGPDDWPWWRGPALNGIAAANQTPPVSWNESTNILWKTPVPGRSHGSLTVVGPDVLLAIADHDRRLQSLICLDRSTGKLKWETVLHNDGVDVKGNEKSSMASASPACDGDRIFINFHNADSVWMHALKRDGTPLWKTRLSGYVNHQGFGSSPLLHGDLVIGASDNKGGGAVVAMHRQTGDVVWKRDRPAKPNYPSPVILTAAGRTQLVLTGCDLVTSLDPSTGQTNWEVPGATTECVTTTVTDGERVFTSGGYPKNHVSAVLADGSGKLVWENNSRTYVPSMLLWNNTLFAVLDAGIAICWDSATGQELWKARLGGTFSSSLVLANALIYAANEEGTTFVYEASREKFTLVASNKLGENTFASPSICGNRIYQRVAATENGRRQEFAVCIGS
ncbi:MAG UNVERIFIED_CONTAM: PQQ-like beta-propeller repeat protein [Planctomycetaceae bacterium]|jgi:outer membrane protein assembly factor BamB